MIPEDFDPRLTSLTIAITTVLAANIPFTKSSPFSKRWWTKELSQACSKMRHTARSANKVDNNPSHLSHQEYHLQCNGYTNLIWMTKKKHQMDRQTFHLSCLWRHWNKSIRVFWTILNPRECQCQWQLLCHQCGAIFGRRSLYCSYGSRPSWTCWVAEETSINQMKKSNEKFIFYFFNILNIFLLSDDTDNSDTIRWCQIIQMNNAQQTICIYTHIQDKNNIQAMRTLMRSIWASPLSNRDRTLQKLLYKLQTTSTIIMSMMILSYMLSITHYIILTLPTPSQVLPDAYKSQNPSSIQPPSTKNIHMMLTLTVFHSYFLPQFCTIYYVCVRYTYIIS